MSYFDALLLRGFLLLLSPNVKIGHSDAVRSLIPTHQDTDMDKIQIWSQIPTVM